MQHLSIEPVSVKRFASKICHSNRKRWLLTNTRDHSRLAYDWYAFCCNAACSRSCRSARHRLGGRRGDKAMIFTMSVCVISCVGFLLGLQLSHWIIDGP